MIVTVRVPGDEEMVIRNRSIGPWSCRTEGVTLAGEIEESPTVATVHEMSLSESPRPDGTVTVIRLLACSPEPIPPWRDSTD